MSSDAKNDTKLLEVQPLVTAGNDSVDTRRNEPSQQIGSDTNMNPTTLTLTGTTSVTWEIIPTTSNSATNTTNKADDSIIQMRSNDNSTKTQSGTVPLVVAGGNSAVVSNATEGSNSTTAT